MLELERGVDRLLHGRYEVLMMKRYAALKAILFYPGKKASSVWERVSVFRNEGWMGWEELEGKEAEILSRSFEDGMG